jgi:hypothetical protein
MNERRVRFVSMYCGLVIIFARETHAVLCVYECTQHQVFAGSVSALTAGPNGKLYSGDIYGNILIW